MIIENQGYIAAALGTAIGTAVGWFFRWRWRQEEGAWSQVAKLWEFSAQQQVKIGELENRLAKAQEDHTQDRQRIAKMHDEITELQNEVDELLIKGGAAPKYRRGVMRVNT
jgi:uncharacterized protein HemX